MFRIKQIKKTFKNINNMKKYMIDYENGSGSGCDKVFDTREDAEWHMRMFYTDKEREGLVIVEIEEE